MNINYFRRNVWNISVLIICILFSYILTKNNIIASVNITTDLHFNILTINSIFAGFLFTSLGIMVSLSDKPRISKLDIGGYMDNYYNAIYTGLFFHIFSTLIALLEIMQFSYFKENLLKLEQFFLIFGVIFFIKAVLNIVKIISKIRYSKKQ